MLAVPSHTRTCTAGPCMGSQGANRLSTLGRTQPRKSLRTNWVRAGSLVLKNKEKQKGGAPKIFGVTSSCRGRPHQQAVRQSLRGVLQPGYCRQSKIAIARMNLVALDSDLKQFALVRRTNHRIYRSLRR